MFDKIKQLQSNKKMRRLIDVRVLGLAVFLVIVLLVSWSGVKVIQSNYDLQKQISVLQQQNDLQELENSNLKLKNQYLATDHYLELTARKHFNKAAPGETLLIVPESVALAHTVDIPSSEAVEETAVDTEQTPWYEQNFNAWLDFLFRPDQQE
jgi:cell division protein FtsB